MMAEGEAEKAFLKTFLCPPPLPPRLWTLEKERLQKCDGNFRSKKIIL